MLPGEVIACKVGALCPDETALYVPDARAMVFADALVRGAPYGSGPLGFVPDQLMDGTPSAPSGACWMRLPACSPTTSSSICCWRTVARSSAMDAAA